MISVIIPVYNNEKYIARCLDSVLTQTDQNIEIIVINDGSTDLSDKIIEEYVRRDSRFLYLKQKNQGVSVARNTGLDHASGTYVIFLDSDDYLNPDTLEYLRSVMVANDLDCVSYPLNYVYNQEEKKKITEGKIDCFFYSHPSYQDASDFLDQKGRAFFYSSCEHLFKRSLIEKIHLRFVKDLKCGEDTLFAHIYGVFVHKGCLLLNFRGYNYFQHSASCIHVNTDVWEYVIFQYMRRFENFYVYMKKNRLTKCLRYELAHQSWEFLIKFFMIEKENPNKKNCSKVMHSRCLNRIIYPAIFCYGPWRRKLMTLIFLCNRTLFSWIVSSVYGSIKKLSQNHI